MRNFDKCGTGHTAGTCRLRGVTIVAIFLLACMKVSAAANSYMQQTDINLDLKEKSVREVLAEIEKTTEYVFFYFNTDIDLDRVVTMNVRGKKINEVLDKLFASTDNKYLIRDRQIYISKEASGQPASTGGKKRVTGTVMDQNGDPLIGVTVVVQNTSTGTSTNNYGIYILDAQDSDILVFNYIGYMKQEVLVSNREVIDITLQEDLQQLEEVVVVGYGQQTRAQVVGSVSSVSGSRLQSSSSNLTSSLAGQVAGLISIQRSAEPGRDDADFWIRGISTFRGSTTPLVLVDGIPRDMNFLDPDEIETFTVLKDASATAVYGAEGANGVILITTKRGLISAPKVSFKAEYSIKTPQRVPKFVDSWDFLELANEANYNDGQSPYMSQEEIEKYRNRVDNDLYPNSKWMDELLSKHTHLQRYTLGFRGGAENAKYSVTMAYVNEDGIFKDNPLKDYSGNFNFERYNLRSNIDLRVSKTTQLSVDLSGQYRIRTTPNRSPDDIFAFMLHTPPHLFPAIYSDGTLATYSVQSDNNNRNPYNMVMNQGYRGFWNTRIQSNVGLIQDLDFVTPGLKLNGKVSFDYDGNRETLRNYWPSLYHAEGRDPDTGKLIFKTVESGSPAFRDLTQEGNSSIRKIYIEGAVNYARTFGKHSTGAMVLYNQKEEQRTDVVLPYRKQSVVGRVTYSYDSRYFIEGNFGYTGSETFAKDKRFGFFPAVGVSYWVSNEKFYPEALKRVMNKLNVKFSYGLTGNDDTGGSRFLYRAAFSTGGYNFYQGITSDRTNALGDAVYDTRFINNDIHWEIEKKRNITLDMGFFGNRLEVTAEYFHNRREDILVQRNTLPKTAGFHQGPWENYGIVENRGTDISATLRHNFGEFMVSGRGTFTFARNKIIEMDELDQPYPWMAQTGKRVNEHNVYIAERLYTEDDFYKYANPNGNGTYLYTLKPGIPSVTQQGMVGPGDIKYRDMNGDGVIDDNDLVRGAGYPYNPEIIYGFGINLEWRGIYVAAFFQGAANTSILMTRDIATDNTFFPFNWGIEKSNYRSVFLNRWTEDNPSQDVAMPRLHNHYENNINKEHSTWWLFNGNFLRFKSFEVGWNLPKKYTSKIRLDGLRVYVMGDNLHLWDKFGYWDPELGSRNKGTSYPNSRAWTFGLELHF